MTTADKLNIAAMALSVVAMAVSVVSVIFARRFERESAEWARRAEGEARRVNTR